MNLNAQIKSDIKDAMRAKDTQKRDTLRNIQVSVKDIEVNERREVTDADVEAILVKYAKQREDAMAQFQEAGLVIIKTYLPEQMSDEELEATLKEIITQTGATTMKDMGKVMGAAKSAIGSRADGGRINLCVKTLLN